MMASFVSSGSLGMGSSPHWTNRTVTTQLFCDWKYVLSRIDFDWWSRVNMMRYTSQRHWYLVDIYAGVHDCFWASSVSLGICPSPYSTNKTVITQLFCNWKYVLSRIDFDWWSRVNVMRYTSQTNEYHCWIHDGSLGIIRQPWDMPFTSLDQQNSHNTTLL